MSIQKTNLSDLSNGVSLKITPHTVKKCNAVNGKVPATTKKSIVGSRTKSSYKTAGGKVTKNRVKAKKAVKTQYLSWETRHAYNLQSIEINSPELLEAFPSYHPMWLIQSQKRNVNGKQFKYMREFLVRMSIEECAAYLRVNRTTIGRWESEKIDTPFMAYEALRLLCRSIDFKLASKQWDGWFINDEGKLVCAYQPQRSYSPYDLLLIQQLHRDKSTLEAEIARLQHENLSVKNELSQLKQIAGNELALHAGMKSIEEKLHEVFNKVANSKLFEPDSNHDAVQIESRKAA